MWGWDEGVGLGADPWRGGSELAARQIPVAHSLDAGKERTDVGAQNFVTLDLWKVQVQVHSQHTALELRGLGVRLG